MIIHVLNVTIGAKSGQANVGPVCAHILIELCHGSSSIQSSTTPPFLSREENKNQACKAINLVHAHTAFPLAGTSTQTFLVFRLPASSRPRQSESAGNPRCARGRHSGVTAV